MTQHDGREYSYHETADPHRRSLWITDVVLGGQDGLVNVLGVILGIAVATRSMRIVLVAGISAALAESVSMAAVAYTSSVARGELYKAERAREYRHIEAVPQIERSEIREIYARKGFSGPLLDQIVATITNDKNTWVSVMMAEEFELADVDRRASARSAFIVGCSALVGSLLPLVPFLVLPVMPGAWASGTLAAMTLFAFGAYKAKRTVGRPLRGGLELAGIGMLSALIGYAVGVLLAVP
ncbi:MAG: VIT1/CCC1 transporter family protein [Polyangiaceae bacterium]|nr:VIT1/CCC1 transporter family protein [Polyangiaceae bacterium]